MPPSLSRCREPSGSPARLPMLLLGLLLLTSAAPPARCDEPAPGDDAGAAAPPAAPTPAPTPPPSPPARNVGPVSVTATRATRPVLETPGHVTVLTHEDIQASGVSDLPDLLRREAGIYVTNTTTNPAGYNVEARGFNNGGGNGSNMLVLVDGRRVNETQNGVADWALIPIDDIEKVEIVRGAASAVYGDNAEGGVIQIFTRRPEGPAEATLQGRAGSRGTWDSSLFARGKAGPISASFFTDRGTTDGFRDLSDYRNQLYHLDLHADLGERASAGVQMGYSSDRRDLPGAVTFSPLGPPTVSEVTNSNDVRTRYLSGSFEVAPLDDLLLTVSPYSRAHQSHALSSQPGSFDFSTNDRSDENGLDAQIQIDRALLELRNRLILGLDWAREDADLDSPFISFTPPGFSSVTTNHNRRSLLAGYLQDELWLTDALLLDAGVRFDSVAYRLAQTTDGAAAPLARPEHSIWSPRVALTYRVLEPLSAYISYARGFRFPTLEETAQFAFFAGNPALRPQISSTYESGLKWRSPRLRGDLVLYWMDVRDEILFDPNTLPLPQNVNLDRTRHRGVEAGLGGQPFEWLDLSGSFTYDDATIRHDSITGFDGNRVPINPVYRWNANATLLGPYGLRAGLDVYWVGRRSFGNDLANQAPALSPYARYDLVLRWHPDVPELLPALPWGGLDLSFTIRNLTDRHYSEVGSRSAFTPGVVGVFPAPGRSYLLGLTLTAKP